MKKVFVTKHANEQMLSRGISLKDIEEVLSSPNIRVKMRDKKKQKVISTVQNKGTLNIVCRELRTKFVIITAWWGG